VLQELATTELAIAELKLDKPVGIFQDFHLFLIVIHRIENPVQLAGEMIFEKAKGGEHPIRLVRLITLSIILDGQAKGLEATASIVGMAVRQPLYPGSDVTPSATVTRLNDKLHTQQGSDVGHGNSS